MNIDDSVLLNELQRRVNEAASKNGFRARLDVTDVMWDIMEDADFLPVQIRSQIEAASAEMFKERSRSGAAVRREIMAKWRNAFKLLDRCVASADYLHSQLTEIVFDETTFTALEHKNTRPRKEAVTGALLKCLLLLLLQARACIVASEISFLIKSGFVDGAESRLRTLYEHYVVLTLISKDQTYKVAERYQDYAAVVRLKEVRALLRDWQPDIEDGWQDEEIELAADVQAAVARWGSDIKEPYGWALPLFPGKKRISFVDLEKVAGAEQLRSDYLRENEHVHAGSYATMTHFDFSDETNFTRPRKQDSRISFIGGRTAVILKLVSMEAATGICWTTEEYDQFMMYFPMHTLAAKAARRFNHSEELVLR